MTLPTAPAGPLLRLEELAPEFETALRSFAARAGAGGIPNLHDAMAYALAVDQDDPKLRGKRIRPLLCLLSAEALGAPAVRAMPFALAIELMHNFCLVHDDIEDGDLMRRGRPSLWIRHGLAHAINAGDYLLVQTWRALAEEGTDLEPERRLRLFRLLGEALDRTHAGQALDINARTSRDFAMPAYMRLVREKTGFYLAAPIQGGAIVAGAGEDAVRAVEGLAALLGPLFQIMDDIIDLTDGKGRDALGSDIREGKRSFLVAHAAERASPADRERLFAILDKPREETSAEDVTRVAELFESTGAVEAGRECCRRLYEESLGALAKLPGPLAATLGPVFEHLAGRGR